MKDVSAPELLSPVISPVNFFALLLVILLGLDFLDFPYEATKTCGPNGYWPLLAAIFLFALPLILLLVLMRRRFPSQDLTETALQVLGKPLGMAGNLVFLSSFVLWLILAVRDGSELVLAYFLNRTPVWAVIFIFLIGIGYVALNGLAPVLRLAAFVLIPTVIFRFLMQVFALQGLKSNYLLPLFARPPLDYLTGGLYMANVFLPISAVFLIYPLVQKPGKLGIPALSAGFIAALSFLLGVLGAIGSFSAELVPRFAWSEFATIQQINVPFLVLEQVGLIFLVIWLTMFFTATSFYFSAVARSLGRQFPALNYRWIVAVLLVIVLTGTLLFPDAITAHNMFTLLRRWLALPVFVYPWFVYLVALLRRKKGKIEV
ncbi:MAG TPA: GerAB/ArcD/ProY family transporter [Bacillota bacterium]|nr:GerAB/ArcD/ProY family transporter [Bacillota bacterium]